MLVKKTIMIIIKMSKIIKFILFLNISFAFNAYANNHDFDILVKRF